MPIRALFILVTILTALMLYSCSAKEKESSGSAEGDSDIDRADLDKNEWYPGNSEVRFSDIIYSHPDTEALLGKLKATEQLVLLNEVSADEQITAINECIRLYSDYETMMSYAQIRFTSDRTDARAREDFAELYKISPELSFASDRMLIAAGQSEHKERFEEELFGKGYFAACDDTATSEAAKELLVEEARLEAELLCLTSATLPINYEGELAPLDDLEKKLEKKFGKDSKHYENAMSICRDKYSKKRKECCIELCTELLKTRSRLAEELGYQSYADYAYRKSTVFSEDNVQNYTTNVLSYVYPVYKELSEVFDRYFYFHDAPNIDIGSTIDSLGSLYTDMDGELGTLYAYMIGGGLYSVREEGKHKANATVPYLKDYKTPFVFINSSSSISDHLSIARSFGSFASGYVNNGCQNLDLSKLSEEGLRMLTLAALSDKVSADDYKFLLYSELNSVFEGLILQSFYSRLEFEVYSLPYSQIDSDTIEIIVKRLAETMEIEEDVLGADTIEALALHPFSSPSGCIALSVGLEIFFAELECKGEGVKLYKKLISEECSLNLEEKLEANGLSSPFEHDYLKELSDEVHFMINGSHYFENCDDDPTTACRSRLRPSSGRRAFAY